MILHQKVPLDLKNKMRYQHFTFFYSALFFIALSLKIRRAVSTSSSRIVKRYENIRKAPNDVSSYRGLLLDNDLKILLVNEPKVSEAVIVLTLSLGTLNDFDDLPGTTYLFGEMLNRFGTVTHPDQEIIDILESRVHDIVHDAVFPETEEDEQIFGLIIKGENLTPTLEIFAQFFNEPSLLTTNSRDPLEKCILHLDWMHSPTTLNIELGALWRYQQVKRSVSAQDHPFHRSPYGTSEIFNKYLVEEEISGESETLQNEDTEPRRTILHKKLQEFHSKWFSSNIMSLVIFSGESLDHLERITVPLFENLENKHVERLTFSYEQHPWGQEQLRRKIYASFETTASGEAVRLVFRVPDTRDKYKTAPELYVSKILKRGGPGSLISVLRDRKLCTNDVRTKYNVKAGIAFFSIRCEIPRRCEMREDEIVELIIQYIRFLKICGINELIFREQILRDNLSFSRPYRGDRLHALAFAMHNYPMEDVLVYKYPTDWEPSLIEEFLTYLTPDYMNIFISSKQFENITPEQDEWHKIPFKVEVIPEALIQRWKTMEISSDFQVPRHNEFIAENLSVHPVIENESESPYIIYESPRSRFWLSQDDESPNVFVKFDLINLGARSDPSNSTLLCIFSELLINQMVEYQYALETTDYKWKIRYTQISISIDFHGYLDRMEIVLKKFMSKIRQDYFTGSNLQDQFEKARVECINREKTDRNYPSAVHRLTYLLTDPAESWSFEEILAASQLLQFEDWKKFISKMLRRVYIQGLILGNCVKQTAIDIAKIIEAPFGQAVKLVPQQISRLLPRVVEFEGGEHFGDLVLRDTKEKSLIYSTYYQLGYGTNVNIIMSTFLLHVISMRCFFIPGDNINRRPHIFKAYDVIGFLFWTTPYHHTVDFIDSQFEDCIRKIHLELQEMTAMEFEKTLKTVIEQQMDLGNTSSMAHNWDITSRGFYPLQRGINPLVEDGVTPLKKSDIIQFFKNTLLEHSPHRSKYTQLLIPRNSEPIPSNFLPNIKNIENVFTFKNNSSMLSLPPSFLQIYFSQQEGVQI